MKKFRVDGYITTYCSIEIVADSSDEAWDIALNTPIDKWDKQEGKYIEPSDVEEI